MQITGGSGHWSCARSNACAQHAAVERGAVGDEHAALEQVGQIGQRRLGGRRLVDHRLGDPRVVLDPARQRPLHAHQRLPALVQLAAADQHRPDLGQLAGVAGEPVGLGVDDEELRACQRSVRIHSQVYARVPTDCNGACV